MVVLPKSKLNVMNVKDLYLFELQCQNWAVQLLVAEKQASASWRTRETGLADGTDGNDGQGGVERGGEKGKEGEEEREEGRERGKALLPDDSGHLGRKCGYNLVPSWYLQA